MKRYISWVLVLAMLFSLLPLSAFAVEVDVDTGNDYVDFDLCGLCGETYIPATCTAPSYCPGCGTTGNPPLGHEWDDDSDGVTLGVCLRCGEPEVPDFEVCPCDLIQHVPASCTVPEHCPNCGTTYGSALGHDWSDSVPSTCNRCGEINETIVAFGTCGENLTWKLDDAGKLTISGTGAMHDFSDPDGPPVEPDPMLPDLCEISSHICICTQWDVYSVRNVVIEAGVTSIGACAFLYAHNLQSVTIPDTVTSIGGSAFRECGSLSNILIPNSVTSIGSAAFVMCSLSSVTIPDGVTSIGDFAFEYCTSLTSVSIPDSVTSIGNCAFSNCDSLTDVIYCGTQEQWNAISIGNDNEDMTSAARRYHDFAAGSHVCTYCGYRNEVIVASGTCGDNLTWKLDDAGKLTISGTGAMTSYSSSSSVPWYSIRDSVKEVIIKEGVTTIGNWAFYSCDSLTSVTIPDSVTSVGDYAFSYCYSLTSVTIPDSVTSIGPSAFEGCPSLTSVTIPDSVTAISDSAFRSCTSLISVTLPDSVTSIGYAAFHNCNSLTSVTIPDSVTAISDSAFGGCDSLTGIWVDDNNPNYSSDSAGVLYNKDQTVLIQAPGGLEGSYTIPDSVTSIGSSAFSSCDSLTSVTIPDSVSSIGDYAFSHCTSLTSVNIPDSVTAISDAAFYSCYSLTSVTIGNSVTSIGYRAFEGCRILTSVTIPDSVTSIGNRAFDSCTSLTSVSIGNSVTSIDICAFKGCNSLTDVIYCGTQEQWNNISISSGNEDLLSANRTYMTPSQPDTQLDAICATITFDDKANRTSFTTEQQIWQMNGITVTNDRAGAATPLGDYINPIRCYQRSSLTVAYPDMVRIVIEVGTHPNINIDCVEALMNSLSTISGIYVSLSGMTVTIDLLEASDIFTIPSMVSQVRIMGITVYNKDAIDHDKPLHLVNSSLYPESTHNYSSNMNETKTLTVPGATQLILTFNSSSATESNFDYVYILDGNGNQIGKYSGSLANKVVTVPGDTVKICLTSDGSVVRYGYAFSKIEADLLIHPAENVQGYSPTCETDGMTDGTVCRICGLVLMEQQLLPALGHSGDIWIEIVEATCTTEGLKARICDRCDQTETVSIPTTPHSWGDWSESVPADCTNSGVQIRICESCNNTEEQEISPKGHTYTSQITRPTCTEEGYTTYTCNVCGYKYVSNTVAPTGHNYTSVITAPTCTEQGYTTYTCNVCEYKYVSNTVAPTGHNYTSVITAPTCTEEGYTTNTCSVCGDVTITDPVPAKGHTWSAWIQTKAPTCSVEGSQTRFCNCGVKETEAIAKLPHSGTNAACPVCAQFSAGTMVLTEDTQAYMSLTQDLYIDLGGYDLSGSIALNGHKVYGKDSATDDYTNANMGYFTCVDEDGKTIIPEKLYQDQKLQRYMTIAALDGYTFHRFYLGITHVTLKPNDTGFGYKAQFRGDEMVRSEVASIGYNLWLTEGCVVSRTAAFKNTLTLRLKNFDVVNYGEAPVNACVSMTLLDGTVLKSATASYSMRQMVEQINDTTQNYQRATLQNVALMILEKPPMETWQVENILASLRPEATVSELTVVNENMKLYDAWGKLSGNETVTLDAAYIFDAQDTVEVAMAGPYAKWLADYYISIDSVVQDGLYLAGNYDGWGWISYEVPSGEQYQDYGLLTNSIGAITYTEVVRDVNRFSCGFADTLNANAGATITVQLRLTNPEDPNETIVINTITLSL